MCAAIAKRRVAAVIAARDGHNIGVAAAVEAVVAEEAGEIGKERVPVRAAPRLVRERHEICAGVLAVHEPAAPREGLEAPAGEANGEPYVRPCAREAVKFWVDVGGGLRR